MRVNRRFVEVVARSLYQNTRFHLLEPNAVELISFLQKIGLHHRTLIRRFSAGSEAWGLMRRLLVLGAILGAQCHGL
jgi:hypothetical protein